MKKRILSISCDESIVKMRHYVFERAGFEVISAWGFSDALAQCHDAKFDVVVWGIRCRPRQDRARECSAREVRLPYRIDSQAGTKQAPGRRLLS